MNRKSIIRNNVILFVVTILLLGAVLLLVNLFQTGDAFIMVLIFIAGALFWAFINALLHELGHVLSAKKNGFKVVSIAVWFIKKTYKGKRKSYGVAKVKEELGATETVPTYSDNIETRLKNMTRGGLIASLVLFILGVIVASLVTFIPAYVYCFLAMLLPVSGYYLLDNGLPLINEGMFNDGAVIYGIKRGNNSMKVACGLLKIQAELYNGKTPSEIDEKFYFDLPQLPEDDVNFYMLLNARYNYYLDKKDYENAKKVSDRLYGLSDEMPAEIKNVVLTDILYNSCTFDFNEERADALMYELEKYLNNHNTVSNVRAKIAYTINVIKETDGLDMFFDKAVREAQNHPLKGLGNYELKLIEELKQKI